MHALGDLENKLLQAAREPSVLPTSSTMLAKGERNFMSKNDSPLDNIRVASPCPANWNAMSGDGRKRFCGECKLHVYNLSGMTRYDAENLLRLSEGRLCVRYYQRADGTILTADCPVGWAKVKQRVSIFAAAAFTLVLSLFGAMFLVSMISRKQVVGQIGSYPRPTPTPREVPLMGAIAINPAGTGTRANP